jgi:Mce-associated membrane protein
MNTLEEAPSLEMPSLRVPFRSRSGAWRRWLLGTTIVLVAAAVVLGVLAQRASGLAEARDAAAANASKRLPVLISYEHGSLQADLDKAIAQTTGGFRDEYRKVIDEVVTPTATRKKVDTTAVVSGVGVVSAERDRVVVLAFLTQTTSTAGGAPTVAGSRVEVTMVKQGDTWLVSDLKPV